MKNIQISDLSIGDWVRRKGRDENYRVCLIDGVSLTVELAEELGGAVEMNIDEVAGIPITTAILEKNGFEPFEDAYREVTMLGRYIRSVYFWGGDADDPWISIHVCLASGIDVRPYSFTCTFEGRYVHQLQHALRLAGIEKECIL